MSLVSLGNVHVAVIDKTFDASNRTQPICLIPLKTVKEELTYLSGSVNSQMLLDNLSGESICQLAVDHLTAVLGKLKSKPPVNLKVVFSSVKAVTSPPLLQTHQDLDSSDSQRSSLDETAYCAECPSDVTANQAARPSAFEIALRQVLDEEIQFLPTDTLDEEEECSEITNETGACLDLLLDPNPVQSHSTTLELGSTTSPKSKTGTLEIQEDRSDFQTDTSCLQPMSEYVISSETLGSHFTDHNHSKTHTFNLQSESKNATRSDTLGSQFTDRNRSQTISNLQPICEDAARSDTARSQLTGLDYSRIDSSNLQPLSEDATDVGTLRSQFRDMNDFLSHPSSLQSLSEDATDVGTSRSQFGDMNDFLSHPSNLQSLSEDATDVGTSRSQFRDMNDFLSHPSNLQSLSEDATDVGTSRSQFRDMNDFLSHPSDLQGMSEGAAASVTLGSQFIHLNPPNVKSSSPCPNPEDVVKNTCLSTRGQISTQQIKHNVTSIVTGQHTEPWTREVPGKASEEVSEKISREYIVKTNKHSQSGLTLRREPCETVSKPDLLPPVVSMGSDLGASKESEIPTSNLIGGSEIQPEDHPYRAENQEASKISEHGNFSGISVENRSLTECNWTINVSKCGRLPGGSTACVNNPGADSAFKKSKMTVENDHPGHSKSKAPDTCREVRVGKNVVKSIKRGEKCRCIKCGHLSICFENLIKHTFKCHMKTVPCKCTDCGEEIRTAVDFQYHQLKHTEATQKDKDTLNRLAFTLRRKGKYNKRNEIDTMRKKIETTRKEKDTRKKHICQICGKSFISKSPLQTHLRIHSGEKPFHCTICDSNFVSKSSLTSHMHKHSTDKRFSCTLCPRIFTVSISLKQHMLSHTTDTVYRCLFCPMRLPTEDLLTQHMSQHEAQGRSLSVCKICQKRFSTLPQLQRHMRTHTKERPHKCDICGKCFTHSNSLSNHRRLHAKEAERVCCKCGEPFTSKKLRQLYLCNACKTSHDNRLFTCYVCKKGFKVLNNLRAHLKRHSSERRFCSICGKTYKSCNFQQHVVRKHPSHPVTNPLACCAVCGEVFKNNAGLKCHARTHSAENKKWAMLFKNVGLLKTTQMKLLFVHSFWRGGGRGWEGWMLTTSALASDLTVCCNTKCMAP